jgi:hypothetical protein
MSNEEKMRLYGFYWHQHGNENAFTYTEPFYADGENVYHSTKSFRFQPKEGQQMLDVLSKLPTYQVEDYLTPVTEEAYAGINDVVVITGDDFIDSLDQLNIEHDIKTWNNANGFYWKVMPGLEYLIQRAHYGRLAAQWLERHVFSAERYDPIRVDTAITMMFLNEADTKEDMILTAVAARLVGNLKEVDFNERAALRDRKGDPPYARPARYLTRMQLRNDVRKFEKKHGLHERAEAAVAQAKNES